MPLIDCMNVWIAFGTLALTSLHPGASVGATSFWTKKGEAATWFHCEVFAAFDGPKCCVTFCIILPYHNLLVSCWHVPWCKKTFKVSSEESLSKFEAYTADLLLQPEMPGFGMRWMAVDFNWSSLLMVKLWSHRCQIVLFWCLDKFTRPGFVSPVSHCPAKQVTPLRPSFQAGQRQRSKDAHEQKSKLHSIRCYLSFTATWFFAYSYFINLYHTLSTLSLNFVAHHWQ